MFPHYNINNHFYKTGNIDCNLNWLVIDHFFEAVNNNKNLVITVAFSAGSN